MLDIKLIRENPDTVKDGIAKKNANPKLVDDLLALDKNWRELTKDLDILRAKHNELSKNRDLEEAKKNKEEIKTLESKLAEAEKERQLVWWQIPNLPSEDTPVGKDESGNKVLRKWGEPKKFDFKVRDHMEIGELLDIIDTERASKVSGTRFGYLKGGAALLEFALIQHAFLVLRDESILQTVADKVKSGYALKPFVPIVPPVMIRPDVYRKTARLDVGQEPERYYIPSDDVYLIGSAEHTLVSLHMDETILEENLPLRYVGFSTSFRREAGSYGKDTKGILRVHQFDKVEMESFTSPEDSEKEQEFIVYLQEYLMQSLNLPYQVVAVCTGDMGGPDMRQIDIETWLPGQGRYRETHSSDLIGAYQPRRLNTKIKRKNGAVEFLHVNDATVFAVGRMIIAILENYQQKDGSVKVPEALQAYMGGLKEIKK